MHYWLQVQKTSLFDTLTLITRYTYCLANTIWATFGRGKLVWGACTVVSYGNSAITPSWQLYDLPLIGIRKSIQILGVVWRCVLINCRTCCRRIYDHAHTLINMVYENARYETHANSLWYFRAVCNLMRVVFITLRRLLIAIKFNHYLLLRWNIL